MSAMIEKARSGRNSVPLSLTYCIHGIQTSGYSLTHSAQGRPRSDLMVALPTSEGSAHHA
jgi:hypothetical protein